MVQTQLTGARTGRQYLDGLSSGEREVWLGGEKVTHPLEHPQLRGGAARSLARVFDLQHEHAERDARAPRPTIRRCGSTSRT